MNEKLGVWIDHKKAVIVSASAGGATARTVESGIGPHARYSGRAGYPTPNGPSEGRGERDYEGRYREHLSRYYDEVIDRLGQPDRLLIFGPGEAKRQLKERLAHSATMSARSIEIEIETTDKLTDPQIAAKVRDHYGTDRTPA